jgi:hypothetical protein
MIPPRLGLTVTIIWGHNRRDHSPIMRKWMRTTHCACLACGHRIDATSTVKDETPAPKEGDFTICLYCSHLMVFTKNLRVRNLRGEEIIEAAGDKDILEVMKFTAAFKEWRDNEQKKN